MINCRIVIIDLPAKILLIKFKSVISINKTIDLIKDFGFQ